MLELRDATKDYGSGDGLVHALRGVTIGFRKAELVAVLGPSGCGKTTLLNILGGLDSCTSGELVVDGNPTGSFTGAQWDAYRNHDVGFVFQSYSLIPHQTALANVELAVRIGRGASGPERERRAREALASVGLADQAGKRPSELSGGQMQRVAVARALVNDPAVVLADEPTGALDSETSEQVMALLKEASAERLVVMVTHNAELAERYATRVVRMLDGRVVGDTDPAPLRQAGDGPAAPLPARTRLGWRAALGLSFNNMRTKKGRTLLTALAGAVGIAGIALVLSLSNGATGYIDDIQRGAMAAYPITIEAETVELAGLSDAPQAGRREEGAGQDGGAPEGAVRADLSSLEARQQAAARYVRNNLAAFKAYLDDPASPMRAYVGSNGVSYDYPVSFEVYAYDPEGALVGGQAAYGGGDLVSQAMASVGSAFGQASRGLFSSGGFARMLCGPDGLAAQAVRDGYDVLAGSWPEGAAQVVLAVEADGSLDIEDMLSLGLLPASEGERAEAAVAAGQPVSLESDAVVFDDIVGKTLYLLPACERYAKGGDGTWSYVEDASLALDGAVELTVSGVVRQRDGAAYTIAAPVGYTSALVDLVIDLTDASEVVREQRADPRTDVLSGLPFADASDEGAGAGSFVVGAAERTSPLAYDEVMALLGAVDRDDPDSVTIYVDSFEDKEGAIAAIEDYNASVDEADRIAYTDYIGMLTSSVTEMVEAVSLVLAAFIAVSLVVSSIMIAVVTYISVLERTKEIGVLRALGASKGDVSRIFNAETLLEGLAAGLIGVGVAALADIPLTALVRSLTEVGITVSLAPGAACALVLASVALAVAAGLVPSRMAARKDPAVALRTE